MFIYRKKYDNKKRLALLKEFDDLMMYLHNDDSTGQFKRLKEKFSTSIAEAMPIFCEIHNDIGTPDYWEGPDKDVAELIFEVKM